MFSSRAASRTPTTRDLTATPHEDLRQRALADLPKLALWLLRDARDATTLLRNLEHWADLFESIVRAPSAAQAAMHLLHYISVVCDELQFEAFYAKLSKLAPGMEALSMTIAEQLQAKGRAEGQAESLFLVLEVRGFHLSDELRARITKCNEVDVLEQWLRRAITIECLDELFDA